MLRNRIIHQNELLYVGHALESGQTYSAPIVTNLDKVQSISYEFAYGRSEVSVVGESSPVDRPVNSSPITNLNIDYLIGSFHNEKHLGMKITPQGFSSSFALLSGLADETDRSNDRRNLYLVTSEQGVDVMEGQTGNISGVLCFHDCQINSYNASFTVGDLPRASISLQGVNASYFSSGSGLDVKVLDRKTADTADTIDVSIPMSGNQISFSETFIPGEINVEFYNSDGSPIATTGFTPITNQKVQSFDLSFSINRNEINLVDHKINYDRLLSTPIIGTSSMSIIDHGTQSGDLSDVLNNSEEYKIITKIMHNSAHKMSFTLNKVKIDKISYSHSIGDKKMINLALSFPIDPFNENKSLNFSGAYY